MRRKSKKAEKRELAESLEDARIFASSRHIMDGGFPHPGYSQQTMPLNSIKSGHTPNDQVRNQVNIVLTMTSFAQLYK